MKGQQSKVLAYRHRTRLNARLLRINIQIPANLAFLAVSLLQPLVGLFEMVAVELFATNQSAIL